MSRWMWISVVVTAGFIACAVEEPAPGANDDDDGWFGGEGGGEDGGWDDGGDDAGDDGDDGGIDGIDSEDGLAFLADSRDESGSCTSCEGRVGLYAVVYNPCEVSYELELRDGMLWSSMELVNLETGEGEGMGIGSEGDPSVIYDIGPDEQVEALIEDARLSNGEWRLEVTFNDPDRTRAVHTFAVYGGGGGGGGSSGSTDGGDGDVEDPPDTGY